MTEVENIQVKSKNLIADGKVSDALSLLKEFAIQEKPNFEKEIIILSNRYNTIHKNKILNIISHEKIGIEEAKINLGLLEIIDQLGLEQPIFKGERNLYFYLGLFFSFGKKILGMGIVFVSIVIFFIRKDVVFRIMNPNVKAPIEHLFFPGFLLIVGIFIYNYRSK